MSRRALVWTMWVLLIGLLLGGAYAIVERSNPGLRNSADAVPPGFVH
jgi:hypothetical protein